MATIFSAEISIGSQGTRVNVILDTGSSALALKSSSYNPKKDSAKTATALAQMITYGIGGWAGPVLKTTLSIGTGRAKVSLTGLPVAVAHIEQRDNFQGVDGILGLAYSSLDDSFDFKNYFSRNKISPALTFPWPFPGNTWKKFSLQFARLIMAEKIPRKTLPSFLTVLEASGIITNKFSLYTRRSWVHKNFSGEKLKTDPLNNGFFILGGGEEQTDLYSGVFSAVKVLHDLYYNTNLKAIRVEGCNRIAVSSIQKKYKKFVFTNSIIDSGTSHLTLAANVYDSILNSLHSLNPKLAGLIKNDGPYGTSVSELKKHSWPALHFIFEGTKGEVTLSCSAFTYWQQNYPEKGKAVCQLVKSHTDANYTLMGLPLLNNYYTIFDRSKGPSGEIKFATIKPLKNEKG